MSNVGVSFPSTFVSPPSWWRESRDNTRHATADTASTAIDYGHTSQNSHRPPQTANHRARGRARRERRRRVERRARPRPPSASPAQRLCQCRHAPVTSVRVAVVRSGQRGAYTHGTCMIMPHNAATPAPDRPSTQSHSSTQLRAQCARPPAYAHHPRRPRQRPRLKLHVHVRVVLPTTSRTHGACFHPMPVHTHLRVDSLTVPCPVRRHHPAYPRAHRACADAP